MLVAVVVDGGDVGAGSVGGHDGGVVVDVDVDVDGGGGVGVQGPAADEDGARAGYGDVEGPDRGRVGVRHASAPEERVDAALAVDRVDAHLVRAGRRWHGHTEAVLVAVTVDGCDVRPGPVGLDRRGGSVDIDVHGYRGCRVRIECPPAHDDTGRGGRHSVDVADRCRVAHRDGRATKDCAGALTHVDGSQAHDVSPTSGRDVATESVA